MCEMGSMAWNFWYDRVCAIHDAFWYVPGFSPAMGKKTKTKTGARRVTTERQVPIIRGLLRSLPPGGSTGGHTAAS